MGNYAKTSTKKWKITNSRRCGFETWHILDSKIKFWKFDRNWKSFVGKTKTIWFPKYFNLCFSQIIFLTFSEKLISFQTWNSYVFKTFRQKYKTFLISLYFFKNFQLFAKYFRIFKMSRRFTVALHQHHPPRCSTLKKIMSIACLTSTVTSSMVQ